MSAIRWDLFCNVIDNFGDIAVTWRLARELHAEHGLAVRVWVDDLGTFHRLVHAVDPAVAVQALNGVEIHHWTVAAESAEPADVVVDAFGARPPDAYLAAMARRSRPPVWINLEYLSAEDWVDGCHGLPSPHPTLPLTRHFFFPGFGPATGGLLAEHDLAGRRQAFLGDRAGRESLWAQWGWTPPDLDTRTFSLFGYGGAAVPALLTALANEALPTRLLVTESRVLPDVLGFLGVHEARPGEPFARGALEVGVLPFLTPEDYDRLLWLSDCNFVRGEDSFVRAQWAERPFVWQIYPQDEGAHWPKLHTFANRYGEDLEADALVALREFWRLWNRNEASSAVLGAAWRRFWGWREEIDANAAAWAARLRTLGSLSENLVRFAVARI